MYLCLSIYLIIILRNLLFKNLFSQNNINLNSVVQMCMYRLKITKRLNIGWMNQLGRYRFIIININHAWNDKSIQLLFYIAQHPIFNNWQQLKIIPAW